MCNYSCWALDFFFSETVKMTTVREDYTKEDLDLTHYIDSHKYIHICES